MLHGSSLMDDTFYDFGLRYPTKGAELNTDPKKYQVFVSSTYEDLKSERQEIMHALLELDCIPSGMELFPAASEDQWSLIKGVIDDCDYYIVVMGGRYGSLGPDGISYTEMEYRYAASNGKPIIAFLHKDISSLPSKYTEQSEEGRKLLEEFRKLAQQRMCKYWTTPQELGSVVSRSLIMLQKHHPGIGWVRGDQLSSEDATVEILDLRKQIEKLKSELSRSQTEAPKGVETLAQGDNTFDIPCSFLSTGSDQKSYRLRWSINPTWNQIFSEVSPTMLHEANTTQIQARLTTFANKCVSAKSLVNKEFKGYKGINSLTVDQNAFETILIQLSALGLITQNFKNRSVKDRGTYWTLTPYGITLMNRLRAVTKSEN